ncbi:lysine-rich nucleolar protein 1-like [Centroberyx affinis]
MVKKKKKKEAKTALEAATPEGANEAGTQEIQHNAKRKKAGKDKLEAAAKEDKEIKHKKRGGEEEKSEKSESRKKKGIKERRRKASAEASEVEEREPKKKRKTASSKGEEEEPLVMEEEQSRETHTAAAAGDTNGKKKKRKKSSSEVKIKVESEKEAEEGVDTSAKKKKSKKIKLEQVDNDEQEDQGATPHMDVVFLSEKTGNTDEVTINQERRLALQMEIDKASQPRIPAKPSGLGQWGTAQFDSSAQQQKFLRLMGGFKKGAQPAGAGAGRENMALGKEAQQNLQQALQGEFERAQSRRMDFSGRGAGLGFAAPSNKKFSIDVNACRSTRFDD